MLKVIIVGKHGKGTSGRPGYWFIYWNNLRTSADVLWTDDTKSKDQGKLKHFTEKIFCIALIAWPLAPCHSWFELSWTVLPIFPWRRDFIKYLHHNLGIRSVLSGECFMWPWINLSFSSVCFHKSVVKNTHSSDATVTSNGLTGL